MIFYLNRMKMKTRTIINKRIEFVCTVMNNKVYYSEKERKRIESVCIKQLKII